MTSKDLEKIRRYGGKHFVQTSLITNNLTNPGKWAPPKGLSLEAQRELVLMVEFLAKEWVRERLVTEALYEALQETDCDDSRLNDLAKYMSPIIPWQDNIIGESYSQTRAKAQRKNNV